ncbi:DNA mismatch repair endonuclease MutL [Bacteroidota bacterium]
MPDIIRLLPDTVANQIAAGEVIQRPASVVKELLENAVDSGAKQIKLIIKDAGKTLVHVIDNGCGMSDTDARLSFERHATSKIRKADDLYAIRTMGFRGEALASIASISQVELKTKKVEEEIGTEILIEGAQFKGQNSCSCSSGTSVAVKNLFYNVPARRKFLKSDLVEIRHIIEEFQRIALVNADIEMTMHHNNKQMFILKSGSLKQRIINIFGNHYNQRLVPVEQQTEYISIYGYIGKPEFAKKTRGDQYIFVNHRYIRHPYLNHAIENAYHKLLPEKSFPTYFLYMEINPKNIDINIHPTKTEVKFEDEKMVYAFIRSSVKLSLGKFNLTPTIDFDIEQSFIPTSDDRKNIKPPEIKVNPDYNPFETDDKKTSAIFHKPLKNKLPENWDQLYAINKEVIPPLNSNLDLDIKMQDDTTEKEIQIADFFQIQNQYIITNLKSGLLLIDQQKAHERILFEHYLDILKNSKGESQQLLYPQTITFSSQDAIILNEIFDQINLIGFDINDISNNSYVINGIPSDIPDSLAADYLEGIIENYKNNKSSSKTEKNINLAHSIARRMSVKKGKTLKEEEMQMLVDKLFACKVPSVSPDGKPVLISIPYEEIENRFNKKT